MTKCQPQKLVEASSALSFELRNSASPSTFRSPWLLTERRKQGLSLSCLQQAPKVQAILDATRASQIAFAASGTRRGVVASFVSRHLSEFPTFSISAERLVNRGRSCTSLQAEYPVIQA